MKKITPVLFFLGLLIFACTNKKTAQQTAKATNQQVAEATPTLKNTETTPVQNTSNESPSVGADNIQWTSAQTDSFLGDCLEKTKVNPSLDGNKYCNCLLDMMKDTYAPNKLNNAVRSNPKATTACLKQSMTLPKE